MMNSINNNDALFSYILSKLILSKKTKHIALPILNIDIKFSQMNDIIKPYDDIYNEMLNMIENEKISNIFSVRVKENFFKSMTLKEYLESGNYDIKKILFQIIHTLAVLQDEYEGFRHNMLNPDNIYLYIKKETSGVDKYIYKNKSYYIPQNTIELKITNFSYSNIPKLYGSDADIPFFDKENVYFDLHYFLNTLIPFIEKTDNNTNKFFTTVRNILFPLILSKSKCFLKKTFKVLKNWNLNSYCPNKLTR
jgi:hypothetical protein